MHILVLQDVIGLAQHSIAQLPVIELQHLAQQLFMGIKWEVFVLLIGVLAVIYTLILLLK